jgi:hypothetical protein
MLIAIIVLCGIYLIFGDYISAITEVYVEKAELIHEQVNFLREQTRALELSNLEKGKSNEN